MGMDRIAARLAENQPPLRVGEVAALLGCSRTYLHKLIEAGTIDAGRVGHRFAIPVAEARRLVEAAGILPTTPTTPTT